MQFNSFEFFAFYIVVFVAYWLLRRPQQNWFLLVASYVFYGWWDWRFLGLLGLSTLIDFFVARAIGATDIRRRRRILLACSLTAQVGILAFFKYFGFFVDSAASLAQSFGLEWHPRVWSIILPVGVSFYTFQTMSYTIDVYRGRLRPERSLRDFALFVAFFPQLVAGPISRATDLLPQVKNDRPRLDADRFIRGATLIITGLVRKVVIADTLAPLVNRIFGLADFSSWKSLVVATVAFGLQIYGDFAGYSDIARGTARLLGFDLIRNFRQPYLSRNITEFWRRWHISLSMWLRDYLYIPLGGSRRGPRRTYVNLIIVMLLGGLWHGAAWTFAIWGLLHGSMLAVHKALRGKDRTDHERSIRVRDVPSILLTFAGVSFAWIFFRASSLALAGTLVSRIVTFQPGFFDILDAVTVVVLFVFTLTIDAWERAFEGRALVGRRRDAVAVALGVGVAALVVASGSQIVPFIYFQF